MTIIRLCGQQLKISAPVIAADTIDYIEMAVEMSEDWQRMDAVFVRFELNNYYVEAQVRDGRIRKEQHLNLTRGSWRVSAYGVRSSGEDIIERITSTTASLDVKVTGAHGGEPLPPDSQGVIEALKAQIAGKLDKQQDAEDAGKVLGIGEDGRVVPVETDFDSERVVIMDYADVTYAAAKAAYDEGKTVIVRTQPRKPTWMLDHDDEPMVVFGENLYLTMAGITFAHIVFSGAGKFGSDTFALMLTLNASDEKTARAVLLTTVTEDIVADWGYTKNTGTYDKPVNGIPESDLSADVRIKLNSGGGGGDVTKETVKEWGFAEEGNLGALRVYPNEEFPIDALAYHAQYDALVNAGIAHRSEPFYLSWDSAREYPIYTYHISPNEDWMTSGYAHNQNNDGSNPLYKRKKIFITSGLHGNERGTPNFLFEFFAKGLASEQTAKTLGSFDWVLIPLVNPWGYSNSFLNRSGAQVHENPTYPGGGELPSGYSVANNKSGYNAGIRRNREMIDINRDFSDAQYTSGGDTLGFVTEEARYVRDTFIAESPDMGFDLHQSGTDTSPGFCSFGLVSPQVLPADEFAVLKTQLYTVIDQGNRLCDAAIQSFYDLPYGHQFSHVWNGTTSHTLRNYMSGYSSSGVGNADYKDKAVKYSFCIETDRRCSELGGNSWNGEQSKIFGSTYVNAILCTVTGLLNQPTGRGSDFTKETVRGWGFAYQSEIPDNEQLEADVDTLDDAVANLNLNWRVCVPSTRNVSQGYFRTEDGSSAGGNATAQIRCRTSIQAFANPIMYICPAGFKMRVLFYGAAESPGTGSKDTYTGEYTGWSRLAYIPALTYAAIVFKRDDNSAIVPNDIEGKFYSYKGESYNRVSAITAESTDEQYPSAKAVWELFNSIPNAEGVGF